MDLRRHGQVIRSWLWLLIASLLLAGGAAYLVSSSLPKVYEAKVTLLVGQSSSSSTPNYNDLLASQRISQTYADLATTGTILGKVMANAGLDITVDEFRARVKADAPTNSTLVTVTVQDGEPARAATLANAIGDQLIAASDSVYGKNSQVQDFIAGQISATQVQIQDTQTQIDSLAALTTRTNADTQQLQALRDRITSLRASYASLLGLPGSGANAVTVVDPATPPLAPSSPRVLLNTLLAALVGLLLALGIAFTMEYLDDTVKSPEDVESATGLATLGTVLKMKGEKGRSEIYRLATLLYPRGPAAEAYRTLRTNLEFASVDEPVKTLLVTSSIPSEGKTTTSGNLAVAFAQAGRTVILVDADLRKPGIHRLFDLPNVSGLTSLLRSDDVSVDDVAQATEEERLRIVATGPLPPNPAELLGSHRMQTILERLTAAADLVVVDSPPLQAVADAAILASITDGTLLVIDAGRTRRVAAGRGREALAKSGARVLGAALNRLSQRARSDYVYYDYYGAYGAEAAAKAGTKGATKPAQQGASAAAPAPLADKRG
jgi:succinoglycan biosynthesis transport protein ExoP